MPGQQYERKILYFTGMLELSTFLELEQAQNIVVAQRIGKIQPKQAVTLASRGSNQRHMVLFRNQNLWLIGEDQLTIKQGKLLHCLQNVFTYLLVFM